MARNFFCHNMTPEYSDLVYKEEMLTSSVHLSHRKLVVYRVVSLVILIEIWVLSTINNPGFSKFQYFTIWGLTLVTITFILALIQHHRNLRIQEEGIRSSDLKKSTIVFWRIVHLIYEIALICEMIVTFIFWTMLFPIMIIHIDETTTIFVVVMCQIHFFPFVLLLTDFVLVRMHFIPRHAWIILGVLLAYTVVNVAVTLAVSPVYPILTWTNWKSIIFVVVVTLLLIVGSWALYVLSKRKHTRGYYLSTYKEGGLIETMGITENSY